MKIRILRYGVSDSLNGLIDILRADGHDVKKLLLGELSNYCGVRGHLVINWGSSDRGKVRNTVKILNDPAAVRISSDKLKTFEHLTAQGFTGRIPDWTTNKDEAKRWITEEFVPVYCRTILRGSQGHGIVVANTTDEIAEASLYVKKLPVDREVRIHVFNREVIDFSQKKKINRERREAENITVNTDIRNHQNGWVFAREGITVPDRAKELAISAVSAVGLDFGAVDIVIHNDVPKLLEINSAPGMEGTTLERYFQATRLYISSCQ